MGGALFTLELIADGLCGPLGSLMATLAAPAATSATSSLSAASTALGIGRPALGLRFLDLAPVLIDAPEGSSFGSATRSRVKFEGRGKALAFELPDMANGTAHNSPMPLWLLALAKQPGTESSAVLLASACIDLRGEIARAASDRCAGEAAACPFRRCAFRMTAVRDAGCALTLECYLRVYAGEQRPVTGGELLLEPSAVSGGIFGSVDHAAPEQCCAATQTEDVDSPEGASAEAHSRNPEEQAPQGKSPLPLDVSATSAAGATPDQEGQSNAPLLQRSAHRPGGRDAFFADEILVHHPPGDRKTNAAAQSRASGHTARINTASPTAHASSSRSPTASQVGAARLDDDDPGTGGTQGSPAVSSSLPLVSELVRELFQIREIK